MQKNPIDKCVDIVIINNHFAPIFSKKKVIASNRKLNSPLKRLNSILPPNNIITS